MKRLLAGIIIIAGATLAACSSGGGGGERYPQYYENQFVTSCVDSFSGDPDFSNFCHCYLNEFEAHVTFEDVRALDEDMANDPDYIPQEVEDAVLACVDEVPAGYLPLNPNYAPEF